MTIAVFDLDRPGASNSVVRSAVKLLSGNGISPLRDFRLEFRAASEETSVSVLREIDRELDRKHSADGLRTRRSRLLRRASVHLNSGMPWIAVTKRHLPARDERISNGRDEALVSYWGWAERIPFPGPELYVARLIVEQVLLFLREPGRAHPYHRSARGCLFDAPSHLEATVGGLWGNLCKDCFFRLRSRGVGKEEQRRVRAILTDAVAEYLQHHRRDF